MKNRPAYKDMRGGTKSCALLGLPLNFRLSKNAGHSISFEAGFAPSSSPCAVLPLCIWE